MPAMAAVAMAKVAKVTGIRRARPPILRMSCSPPSAWITLPAPRKRQALKKACVYRWKIATPYAPTPSATNMNPSCEIVEYASTFLMSVCTTAIVAAKKAVAAPIPATSALASGAFM